MADKAEVKPDSEATKWFVLAIVGTALYVGAAFGFVVLADVEPGTDAVYVEQPSQITAQGEVPELDAEESHGR